MEHNFAVHSIGTIRAGEDGFRLELDPAYRQALTGLNGFSHIQILWWFSGCDDAASRRQLTERRPYRKGPETLGVFATRSPLRPNPIALSCAEITDLDLAHGTVDLAYLDAFDNSPVLDIKPYTPSLDRVETPGTPVWCSHWPQSLETSGDFPWEEVFNF